MLGFFSRKKTFWDALVRDLGLSHISSWQPWLQALARFQASQKVSVLSADQMICKIN